MAETPAQRRGRGIDGYGGGGFVIGGQRYTGPVLMLQDRVEPWVVGDVNKLAEADFAAVLAAKPEILLIGCGARAVFVTPALRDYLRKAGISADAMGTGAACRTFNVLAAEERPVAAALIPVE